MKFTIESSSKPIDGITFDDSSTDYYCFFALKESPYNRIKKLSTIDLMASLKNKKNILILESSYKDQLHSFGKRMTLGKNFIEMNPSSVFFFKNELLEWESFESFKNWLMNK